jgi:membrane-associated phospholipid phosphatase
MLIFMMNITKHSKHYFITLVSVILLIINVYAVKAFTVFGSPLLFLTALIAEIILFIILIFSLFRLLSTPETIFGSLLRSILYGLATNTYIKKLLQSKSATICWVKKRFEYNNPYGLTLTVTTLISLFFLFNFLNILLNVVTNGSLTHIDLRILNVIPSLRTPLQTSFFRYITILANSETIILMILIVAVILWRKQQKLLAGFVILVTLIQEAITFVFKHIAHRLRPELALRLIKENSYSFPSGHAVRATVLFGLVSYFIYKSYTGTKARVATVTSYILIVFLIAISRVYLGVHYPSDVWGGILLGSTLLIAFVGVLEICSYYAVVQKKKIVISNRSIIIIPLILVVFSGIATPFLIRIKPVLATPSFITIQSLDPMTIQKLPVYSETLTGGRMEPINFIYVGYEDQIRKIFDAHNWYTADHSTVANTLKALAVGFQGRLYLTAPVTPSYLNFKPENIAFEQSTETHSLKQRHHTRIWRTDYALPDGRPVWVATASFDEGIEFAGTAKLPTHRINPNIDAERTYITNSLEVQSNLLDVVPPQIGKNASGDGFFTDGKAEFINLK